MYILSLLTLLSVIFNCAKLFISGLSDSFIKISIFSISKSLVGYWEGNSICKFTWATSLIKLANSVVSAAADSWSDVNPTALCPE